MTVTRSTGTGLPTRVAAVLFDLDNTLVASEDAWFAATRDLWTEAGGDPTGKGILGGTVEDIIDDFCRDFPGSDPAALSRRLLDLLDVHLSGGAHPTPGAPALVERLSSIMPITIASNSPAVIVRRVVAELGWQQLFTATLGADEVERPKPEPDLYLTSAARCGVEAADCVIFEDSPMGATAARATGAFVVTVGSDAAEIGHLNVADLTDPRITAWTPEVIS